MWTYKLSVHQFKDSSGSFIPIYSQTRREIPFEVTIKIETFDEVKKDLSNPPVLVMPNNKDFFTLVTDTSGVACGATLYPEQRGKFRFVGYNDNHTTS